MIRITFLLLAILISGITRSMAQQTWPVKFTTSAGEIITVYEPQPEQLGSASLKGRAAISVKTSESAEPLFGAFSFTSSINSSGDNILLQTVEVTGAKIPGITKDAEIEKYESLVSRKLTGLQLTYSKKELGEAIRKEGGSDDSGFENTPPAIIYATRPTTLIVLDGSPELLQDDDLGADKVVNSPYLIFREGNLWNLYVGGNWYRSQNILNGWTANKNLSAKLRAVDKEIKKQEAENSDDKSKKEKPTVTEILVVTTPTEIIQTNGEANYKSLANTSLLYAANSTNEIFKDLTTQKTFVLLAGRWYSSPSINGPWEYIASDMLPADFRKIPEGSDKDAVLANVAGTDEAEDALLEAGVPQTAKVDRQTATIRVEYDGQPQFAPVAGTYLQLAENANVTVMIDPAGRYFALENGVWFIGSSPTGPWAVANERPRDIENVPPSSPAYNARFVYIYDQSPRYVYVGYTSGYTGGYVYRRTIVYGTGFRYRPWFRRYYYARPVTWGYGFVYNPWHGWSMNPGYNFGYLFIGYHTIGRPGWGGWFGPPMYRPPYRPPYWQGGYYGSNRRPGPQVQTGRPGAGNRPGNGWSNNPNVYVHHKGVVTKDIDRRPVTRPERPGNKLPGENATTRPGIGTDRPGGTRPGITRPGSDRPGTTKPVGERPGTTRPVTERPGTTRPVIERPGTTRPGTTRPVTERPATTRPITERPGTTRPVTERPGTTRPITERPGTTRPVNERPGTTRPVIEKPGTTKPETTRPVRERPGTTRPGAERPAPTSPVIERPGTGRPAGTKPAAVPPGMTRPERINSLSERSPIQRPAAGQPGTAGQENRRPAANRP